MADMPILPPLSDEQADIVAEAGTSRVIVNSVAGSGKTTTILHIAQTYPDAAILLLTYNARLRLETRDRCEALGIDNVTVHTYHSFGVRHISRACHTDAGLVRFKCGGQRLPSANYDYIIVDECQDMSPLYYYLVRAVMSSAPDANLVIIGDKYQSIYGFAGADARFITLAERAFGPGLYARCNLGTSYRITRQMAAFINRCVLGEDRLGAVKDGPLPRYTVYNVYNPAPIITEIKWLLTRYTPEDIFILAPSVRPKNASNPINMLANALTTAGIMIHVPVTDDKAADRKVMSGKIVFSSFHQAKGLERRAVIVLGFDSTYFAYYNRTDPDDRCSNPLYVALTRATEHLSVYHAQGKSSMKFVNTALISQYTQLMGVVPRSGGQAPMPITSLSVTQLVSHLTSDVIVRCMSLLHCDVVRPAGTAICIPAISKQRRDDRKWREDVSDINGVAIPTYYEWCRTGAMTIQSIFPPETIDDSTEVDAACASAMSPERLLRAANAHLKSQNDINFKVAQIDAYNWLSEDALDDAIQRMRAEFDPQEGLRYEVPVCDTVFGVKIRGRIDILRPGRIYEIKTVSALSPEHHLQLALYAYMYALHSDLAATEHMLLNVRTNELIRVSAPWYNLRCIVETLLCNKLHSRAPQSDEQFIQSLGLSAAPVTCSECQQWQRKAAEAVTDDDLSAALSAVLSTVLSTVPSVMTDDTREHIRT